MELVAAARDDVPLAAASHSSLASRGGCCEGTGTRTQQPLAPAPLTPPPPPTAVKQQDQRQLHSSDACEQNPGEGRALASSMGQQTSSSQRPPPPLENETARRATQAVAVAGGQKSRKTPSDANSRQPASRPVSAPKLRARQATTGEPPESPRRSHEQVSGGQKNNNNSNVQLHRMPATAAEAKLLHPLPAVQTPARPQSAMAGTSGGARRDSAGRLGSGGRAKTTRVRINSTSEQIQDPNWLIRMSKELEQRSPTHKRSHLKSLHRRLKSTITGHHHHRQSNKSTATTATGDQGGSTPTGGAALASQLDPPSSAPATPVKVPVSILKQRPPPGAIHAPQSDRAARAVTPIAFATTSAAAARRSPVPPATGTRALVAACAPSTSGALATSASPQPQQVAAVAASGGSGRPSSRSNQAAGRAGARPLSAPQTSEPTSRRPSPAKHPAGVAETDKSSAAAISVAATTGTQLTAESAGGKASQANQTGGKQAAVPICADGQVRVSGWKRNNLLAKTLSHFDEIRGNQRPVFVPTKIRLPPETAGSSSATTGRPRAGGKFADVVRQAMATKRQSQLDQQAQSSRRVSDCGDVQAPTRDHADPATDIRSVSAGPLSASSPHHSHHNQQHPQQQQQQHRSSSAGVPHSSGGSAQTSGSNKQQQQPVIKTPPARAHSDRQQLAASAMSQPHLMNQLLSVSAHQSSQLIESGSSSTRQFKLQQKNHQVLQNLRRRSNELQASLHAAETHALLASGASGSLTAGNSPSSSGFGGHKKDWKRLTGKLALLTSGRQSLQRQKHHSLTSSADHSPPNSAQLGQAPLRLTVSNPNQETGDPLACTRPYAVHLSSHLQQQHLHKRGSGPQFSVAGLQVPGANFMRRKQATTGDKTRLQHQRSGESASSGQRKLSSSSMIVQPVTVGESLVQSAPDSAASNLQTPLRRSSDSGAYNTSLSSDGHNKENNSPQAGACDSSLHAPSTSNAAGHARSEGGRQPVVVCRDDLLHLLQVTGCGSGSSLEKSSASGDGASTGEARSRLHRRSLQLSTEQMPAECMSTSEVEQLAASSGREDAVAPLARSTSVSSMEGIVLRDSSATGAAGEWPAPTVASVSASGQPSPSAAIKRKTDLSWVVRKTSKVVFFHERLRKMRRNMKQQQQQLKEQQSKMDQATDSTGDSNQSTTSGQLPATASKEQVPATKTATTKAQGADVFMDPTLIGDAIEIFLRNTMQQQQQQQHQQQQVTLLAGSDNRDELGGGRHSNGEPSGSKSLASAAATSASGHRLVATGGRHSPGDGMLS